MNINAVYVIYTICAIEDTANKNETIWFNHKLELWQASLTFHT